MDFLGFFLFIALAGTASVLLILTIVIRVYRMFFSILLAANLVFLLILGTFLYKVYWLDEPLPGAARQGNIVRVQELLSRGASPDSDGIDGVERAIVSAADSGNAEIVSLLIKKGADVDLKDYDGHTAIEVARQKGFTNIVELLIASKRAK